MLLPFLVLRYSADRLPDNTTTLPMCVGFFFYPSVSLSLFLSLSLSLHLFLPPSFYNYMSVFVWRAHAPVLSFLLPLILYF